MGNTFLNFWETNFTNINPSYINLLARIYENAKSKGRTNFGTTDLFLLLKGVRQRDISSAILFCVILLAILIFVYDDIESDCNWTWTQEHLVCKWTLHHFAKLARWLSVPFQTKWFWVRVRVKFQILCLLWARSSGNYKVWIHSEAHTWHDKNIQSYWIWFYSICRWSWINHLNNTRNEHFTRKIKNTVQKLWGKHKYFQNQSYVYWKSHWRNCL